ncbi:MAG: hypothetical protein J6X55_17015 [Victivallales bacterium]|nr:hypothetical protein [Victivallales bacterium]
MKHRLISIIALVLAFCVTGLHADEDAVDLASLPPEQFLSVIRDPLRSDAWSVITGRITHARGDTPLVKGEVRLSIRLSEKKMITQITLNEKNTYILEQVYSKQDSQTKLDLELPPTETKPGLFDFGLRPDDLSFAFFYWDFIRETTTPADASNGLRVIELRNPQVKGASVLVHFNARQGFPIEARWKNPDGSLDRFLELKGAKRHKNGVWFVRDMRLEDGAKRWKTQVRFDYVEKNQIGE